MSLCINEPNGIFVDHIAIKFLVNKPDFSGRLARWVLLLSNFDYIVQYKHGKAHYQTNHLSRLSEELVSHRIDDDLPNVQLFRCEFFIYNMIKLPGF